ncbi:MAG: tetratricopeptide repeat protein [Rhodothermales bacterium]
MKNVLNVLLFLAVASLLACKDRAETPPTGAAPAYLNLGTDASYVGIEACKTCHAAQYETYIRSEMGRSFRRATLSNSDAEFDAVDPVYDPHNDLYYLPFHRGENLFIMEYRVAGRDTVHKRVEQIDYIVGSGQHTNSHIMDENGYLYQMPLTWYAQDAKWSLPPKFEGGNNYRFDRPIPLRCMTCHNALPTFIEGSENRYAAVPHGIDCERCHGPGSIHVREKQAGHIVDITREIDYTIVNPGKLPISQQFDVCRRCHMQGADVLTEGTSAFDFRPGMDLADFENVYWPRYADSLRQFIMASHPDRLQMSRCFLQSHEEAADVQPMTCITCHNPHVGINTLDQDHYKQVCQSCHTPAKNNLCTEEDAVRAENGDNCITCHMPVSGSSDIPHVRITDHLIRTPQPSDAPRLSPKEADAQKRFFGLASLIDDDPTLKEWAEGYLTYYEEVTNHPDFLDSAAVLLERAQRETPPQELAVPLIRLWFFQQDYAAITRLARTLDAETIRDAWTLYRMGEAFAAQDQPGEAVRYLNLAVTLAPEHLRFMDKLASAYTADGQLDTALSLYNAVLEANPKFDEAYNNRGFTRILLGDLDGAEDDLRRALSLDPDAVYALENLASLYYNTNRQAEARPYVKRLLEMDPGNPGYRQLWNLLQ